jgi:hypothetical protein
MLEASFSNLALCWIEKGFLLNDIKTRDRIRIPLIYAKLNNRQTSEPANGQTV